jgi:hypothetical protein
MLDGLECDLATLIDDRLATLCSLGDVALDTDGIECAVHAIERAWDVVIPDRALAAVGERGELVEACAAEIRRNRRLRARRRAITVPTAGRVVITPPEGRAGRVTQSGVLTEYAAEELASTVCRHGAGTQLEIVVPAHSSDASLGELVERFAWLGDEDIAVSVTRVVAEI